jgi:hypothetical protein
MRAPRLLMLTVAFVLAARADSPQAEEAVIRAGFDPGRAAVIFLGWDTEGSGRHTTNLLRSAQPVTLHIDTPGGRKAAHQLPVVVEQRSDAAAAYRIALDANRAIGWDLRTERDRIELAVRYDAPADAPAAAVEVAFPFDPRVTPTTVLPSQWLEDGSLRLPLVISAPDFGQMLLTADEGEPCAARLEGSRAEKVVDLTITLPAMRPGAACRLTLSPVVLAAPAGLEDTELWRLARRGWFGAFQPSARWGEQGRPFSAPPGILANNVISDPASCSLWFYADQALWTPPIAAEISVAPMLRRSVDWWLTHRVRDTGEMVCYWDYGGFLDANAGPIIAAWDYCETSGENAWLASRIERLELIADYLARRDVDGDGLVEAVQSGNRNSLQQPGRSCAWFDALNCGHKDGYTNAIIYRAWCCLSELEGRLGRADQQARYRDLARRLKAGYREALYNPATGWLGWWRSADGELHDYASPIVNGLAIEYGLVDADEGRQILQRLWAKIDAAGFKRLELGVPPVLVPVPRSDYLQPDALGLPSREDGTDTFGQYMNGGITAGQVLHFLAAHYVVGRPEKADALLKAMLERQAAGKFQNGVRDAAQQGIDWTDWQGNATGYEGYLADSFRFLQAVLLREAAYRDRYYRPIRLVEAER